MQISSAEAEPISPNAFAISLTCDNTIFYSLLRRNFSKGFGLFLVGCQVKTLTKILVTSALSQIRSLDFAKTTMVKEISIFQKFNHRKPHSHQDTVLHRQVQPNPPLHGTNRNIMIHTLFFKRDATCGSDIFHLSAARRVSLVCI